MANELLTICAAVCLGSFTWGMIWHFRRLGRPSRALLVTALLGVTSGVIQFIAVSGRTIRFPLTAVVLYAFSTGLFWWAVSCTRNKLAACGQRFVFSSVVTSGPYRYLRHPFYTAYNLAWLAGFVATLWWLPAICAIVMAAVYDRSAREEEKGFLESELAAEYAEYKRRAGRYLPGLGWQ